MSALHPVTRTRSLSRKLLAALAVFAAYAALACITTWPVVTRMTTHLPGDSTDTMLHYWNGWWVQQALKSGQSPFFTPYLFYPNGISLVTHNIAWFTVLPWLLLEPLFGGIVAYNLALLLNLALCGCAAYVLTYKLTAEPRAAFLAGLIYQAWPYRVSQLDHPNLLSTLWIPIFFLFLIYTIREGRWRDGVLAGVCFALVGYTRWQQLIAVTLMAVAFFAFSAPYWLPRGRRYVLTRLVVAGAVAGIALLPPTLLLLLEQRDGDNPANLLREGEDTVLQTDLLAYLTPSRFHPLFGGLAQRLYERYYGDRLQDRNPVYLGLVALSLAALGIHRFSARAWKGRRWERIPWLSVAVVLVLLALGPILRVNGRLFQVPTFYDLLAPLVRLMRVPERFNVFLALPVSVLAAYGVAGLLERRPRLARWPGVLLFPLLGGLAVFEYLSVPARTLNVSHVPSFYAEMAREPGDFAVMNYPSRDAKDYMFEQTIHHRPILRGNISRLPEGSTAYIDSHPRLSFLGEPHNTPPVQTDVGRLLASLAEDHIRYIIVQKSRLGDQEIGYWRRYLLVQPRYEDEQVLIYPTAPEAGRDWTLIEELTPGLGPVQVLPSAGCANPGCVLGLAVGWGSTAALDRDEEVVLSLVDGAGLVRQAEQFPLSTTWPTSQWPANAVDWEFYALRLPPSIPAGEYALTLGLRGGGEPMRIDTVAVQPGVCDLATVPDARDANALFGDELRLLEYHISQEQGSPGAGAAKTLNLDLYWHAEYRMDADFKIFVHVFDPATGIPVAQEDTMPRHWTYPTTRWWPGEVVEDPISISLQGVPAGQYGLAVGVYRPSTGERLALVDGRGGLVADGRLILDETVEVK